ncbi:hypothetical protein GGR42_000940 [Saonia flava]|uniref:Outer membrane protein beta-barrel domain-containing protein n=1 Tax=Saonia flava TaxID=523696 RepID=A0A846QQU6_9FLAO|nr:outer membrane beta-barrel protein [Saonia flava]NJB70478.1 hypothetical protein [Saonia flava]
MIKYTFLLLCIGLTYNVMAQEIKKPKERFPYEGHAYFGMDRNSVHKDFSIGYNLNTNWGVRLDGAYDKEMLYERFRIGMFVKKYLNKKMFLFGGMQLELDLLDTEIRDINSYHIPKGDKYRTSYTIGLGYDINESILIEASYDNQLNNSRIGPVQLNSPTDILLVKSKIKF